MACQNWTVYCGPEYDNTIASYLAFPSGMAFSPPEPKRSPAEAPRTNLGGRCELELHVNSACLNSSGFNLRAEVCNCLSYHLVLLCDCRSPQTTGASATTLEFSGCYPSSISHEEGRSRRDTLEERFIHGGNSVTASDYSFPLGSAT